MKIGYLGPQGTFSELAAVRLKGDAEIIPFNTIFDVIDSVDSGHTDLAVVPIENSTEGTVNITVDTIIFDTQLYITRQLTIPVEHNLIVKPNTDISSIKKIYSHPQAIAQCRAYLHKKHPNAVCIDVNSTAEAVRLISCDGNEETAAIGLKSAARLYNLKIAAEAIQSSSDNYTQFVMLSKQRPEMSGSGKKTSIAFSTLNEPGQLYRLLDILAIWNLNMTKIISRPMRSKKGEYVFFIDIESGCSDKDLYDAITMLKRKTSFFKFIGSYECIG